jgi:hypothetical protein
VAQIQPLEPQIQVAEAVVHAVTIQMEKQVVLELLLPVILVHNLQLVEQS